MSYYARPTFDFLLSLPELDIARDVKQLQVHLVETALVLSSSSTRLLIVPWSLKSAPDSWPVGLRCQHGCVALIETFLGNLLALTGIGDKLHLSRLHEGALEVFHEGLGIERLRVRFSTVSTTTMGLRPVTWVKRWDRGRASASLIRASAVKRESVSFQRPLRSADASGALASRCRACGQCQHEDAEYEPALPGRQDVSACVCLLASAMRMNLGNIILLIGILHHGLGTGYALVRA